MRTGLFVAAVSIALGGTANAEAPATERQAGSITVWDTGTPSANALSPTALSGKNDWSLVKTGVFKGDAVVSNGWIAAVVRQQDSAIEVSAVKPDGAISRIRCRLQTDAGVPAVRVDRLTLVEQSRGSATLEVVFKTAAGASVGGKVRIKKGDVAVQFEPLAGAGKLCIECASRFVVLPDFFADDIVLDATHLPVAAAELPTENFLLQLTANGDAIAMCVFENRKQDAKVFVEGNDQSRVVSRSEIEFEGKPVWVALLEAPQIWHTHNIKAEDTDKIVPLDWKMPFRAQWRVDFPVAKDLMDSWQMLLQDKENGSYIKPSTLGSGEQSVPSTRKRWNTVLGSFPYPCWSDPEGKGYFQPLKSKKLKFEGSAVIYPVNRVAKTPLDAFTAVDVMRSTLGVGPCQHILDLEGQRIEYRGMATCASRDKLVAMFKKNEQVGKQAEVEKTLDDALAFVTHIRGRIVRYVEFGHRMRDYLAEQKTAHPELTDFIKEMETLNAMIDARFARRAAKIQTPAYVAKMNDEFRKTALGPDVADPAKRCKEYGDALVEIGDNQDELSGECRYAIKTLRQRAGIAVALDPRVAPIAAEIRKRTQEALRNTANHESKEH
jgi:hypothetical protein